MRSFRGPLRDSYPAAVALVLLALMPYLILTTSLRSLTPLVSKDLGASKSDLQLVTGMANGAYAFGTVLAVQLASRLRPRRLLVLYVALFIAASAAAAAATSLGLFAAGHILQALMTGLMLIAAVPPLVLNWGKRELPRTAVAMNLNIFGAVAAGPVIGGLVASSGDWRLLFWIVTALGVGALAFTLLTYEDAEPQDPDAPVDLVALVLAAFGCAGAFFGVSELMGRELTDPIVLVPLAAGLAMLAALLVWEWRTEDPLVPVRNIAHTIPIAAIVAAMTAGAASVALVDLAGTALETAKVKPAHTALLFVPQVAMAVVTAFIFGRLLYTRWTALLPVVGLAVLAGAGVVLTGAADGSDAPVLVGSAMVGFGVGAVVSPALFLASFTLISEYLPRVFAFVELLRGVAAFLVAPLLVNLATTSGMKTPAWIATAIAATGLVAVLAIGVIGRVRLQEPELDPWFDGEAPALPSAEIVRGGSQPGRARMAPGLRDSTTVSG